MRRDKNIQSGITLIALVVTIIVLLILAGVSITMIGGDDGIIAKTIKSSEETKKANAYERIDMVIAE